MKSNLEKEVEALTMLLGKATEAMKKLSEVVYNNTKLITSLSLRIEELKKELEEVERTTIKAN